MLRKNLELVEFEKVVLTNRDVIKITLLYVCKDSKCPDFFGTVPNPGAMSRSPEIQ